MGHPSVSERGKLVEQVKGRQGTCSHLWCQHLSVREWAFDLCVIFFISCQSTTESNTYWYQQKAEPSVLYLLAVVYGGLPAGCSKNHAAKPRDCNCSNDAAGQNVKWGEWLIVTAWALGCVPKGDHLFDIYPFCLLCVVCCRPFLKKVLQGCFVSCFDRTQCRITLLRSLSLYSAQVALRAWQIKKFCCDLLLLSNKTT